jgi:DNA-directed RNA polymerase beta subunit
MSAEQKSNTSEEATSVLMPDPQVVPQSDNPAAGPFTPDLPQAIPQAPEATEFWSPEDTDGMRNRIFTKIQDAATRRFPVENDRYRIELSNVRYKGPESYSKQKQKEALMQRKSLNRKLYGKWRMIDKATGKSVDEREELIAHVPYFTERGTFIRSGNEYTVAHQSRLKSGVFVQRRQNGDVQAQFNVQEGGRGFKINMDPKTGKLTLGVGTSNLKLFPVLRALGATNDTLKVRFGDELYRINDIQDNSDKKAKEKFNADKYDGSLEKALANAQLDPDATTATLGKPYTHVNLDSMLTAAEKVVKVNRGEADEDNRDSIEFQNILAPDDLFAERIQKDADRLVTRRLLWNSTNKGKLATKSGFLTPQVDSVFVRSGLAQPGEEVNPIETLDQQYRVLRTGEGGIDPERVTEESRSVQPSHFGIIDPIRSPESGGVGTDSRFTVNTLYGNDGKLYTRLKRPGTDELMPVSAKVASNSVIAFPGELKSDGRRVRAMVRGKLGYIDRRLVNYELPHTAAMSTASINMIPGLSGVAGGRALMAAKFFSQALPLADAEAPLVQALSDDETESFEERYGNKLGAVKSDLSGRVLSVTPTQIKVQTKDGVKKYELYENMPNNRKTMIHNTPVVKAGDRVKPGQTLAKSNFTDDAGTAALGKNLNTAYMVWPGNTDDGLIISEGAAKKLRSEHMYSKRIDHDDVTQRGRKEFMALYPGTFSKPQISKLDNEGVIKPGQVVEAGDPLVLAVREKPVTDIHRGHKPGWMNASETWDHESPGVVTDVGRDKKGLRISVKSLEPMKVGDKLVGRMGDKGVVADIVPDAKMPVDEEGNPLEVLLNPTTVVSRTNPMQLVELALAKVAKKTGKPVKLPGFSDESFVKYAKKMLDKHGLKDVEDLEDPETGRKFKKIMRGPRFFMKLHHMAEHKLGSRGIGGYTSEHQPSRSGGFESAKRLGLADLNALVSYGAVDTLKDAKAIRGQENYEYWKAFQMGRTPPSPEVPFIYKKMMAHMMGSGVNVKKTGGQLNIMALTDKDIDRMSSGAVTKAAGVDLATMRERPGGLFDPSITGGHDGAKWSHLELNEPLPNPVMEEPIRRLLGLTQKQYTAIVSGQEELHGLRGGKAIQEGLRRIKPAKLKETMEQTVASGAKSKRDNAIKVLRYLNMMEKTGIKPEDFVLSKAPVIPPKFRPVSATSDFIIKADANSLYMDLMKANEAMAEMRQAGFSDEDLVEERANLYNAFKAVTGLGDPVNPKLKAQKVQGLLGQLLGIDKSPKSGIFQRRVLGGTLDTIGNAVITPNSSLDVDQVGLPERAAWSVYKPFVMRRLTRHGMSPKDAARNILNKTEPAKKALLSEMDYRPVIINRAPTLHKYSFAAAKPVLTKGDTLQVSPLITPEFNADFDGDTMRFHVPASDEAVEEAKEKLFPSKNLFSVADFLPRHLPAQEYHYGLYAASKAADKSETPVHFDTKKDMIIAYKRGEIGINTPVSIASMED